jgi:hypothetical protein
LVNLALGLAAILSFAGVIGLIPSIEPTRWIQGPWLTAGGLESVPRTIIAIAFIGIDVWLPASLLILLFALVGLHRRLAAPRVKLATAALTLAWTFNIGLLVALLIFVDRFDGKEAAWAIMLAAGFFLVPVGLLLMAGATAAAIAEVTSMIRHMASARSRVPFPLLGWAFVPPIMFLMPLLFAPSNPLALSAKETGEFDAACQDAGVRLMEKPIAPVRSMAYDWNPERISMDPHVWRIGLDESGRILSIGGGPSLRFKDAKKEMEFDYTEYRRDARYIGTQWVSSSPIYNRFQKNNIKEPIVGVDKLSADVLAFLDVDKPRELHKAPVNQGAIRFQLTLTDRRSGTVLGVQSFVVDQVNNRACGANAGNDISHSAFIYDAIHAR